ncbi:MAG: Gfo/Idh/MocA family oxidoreductase, partial [Thermoguttaceae bacterium]
MVGLGLIGRERLRAVEALRQRGLRVEVDCCHDPYARDPAEVIKNSDISVVASLDELVARKPDLVIVSVPHDIAVNTTKQLLNANLSVLVEKPLGRSLEEARAISACCTRPRQLWVGQTFRFFTGIARLVADLRAGWFGRPVGLSILLGHGGAPNDRESWKLDKVRAGGGALIDPGIHLLDLCRIAGGSLELVGGASWSGFWKTGIEEECRLLMRSALIPMIDVTISVVRWRSTFRMELFGEDGYGIVDGRGRSYGVQEYRRGRRWGWQDGRPQRETEEVVVVTNGEDVFADELAALLFGDKTENSFPPPCSVQEALDNMAILDAI